jgi:cytidyltransferase-like protein
MKVGIVFGTFAPMHLGHMDVINIAKEEMDRVIVICCGHEGDRGYPLFPLEKRFELATEEFADDEKVLVTKLVDTALEIKKHWDQQQIWNYWVERMLLHLFQSELIAARDEVTYFTSEEDYAQLLENTPQSAGAMNENGNSATVFKGINVHLCHRDRPVSGTMIRGDIKGNLGHIAPSFAQYVRTIWEE